MDKVEIRQKILSHNDALAAELRIDFAELGLLVLNLVSSPGSGKTSLLEQTIRQSNLRMAVVVGDVQTENDAKRLQAAGGTMAFPIVTNGACHLDAKMITEALERIDLDNLDLLVIENVGILVCPSSYDLGEDYKVVLISTTEGDDKPLKYPGMFRRSRLMVVNKTDLVGHCDFDIERVKQNARSINGDLEFLELSCRTGKGIGDWLAWLDRQVENKRSPVVSGE
jgi:hydrogenase nickel incorporation protein HypB